MKKSCKIIVMNTFWVFLLSLLSCNSKDFDIEINPTTNKLVVYCFFNPDSIWLVKVSKLGDLLAFEKSDLWVKNAIVTLYEDNYIIDTLTWCNNGVYTSKKGLKPSFNKVYQLIISCSGFKNIITSKEMLPDSVNIQSIKYYDYLLKDIFPNEVYYMQLSQQYKNSTLEVELSNSYKGEFFKFFLSDGSNNSSIDISSNSKKEFIEYNSYQCSMTEAIHGGVLLLQTPINIDYQVYLNIYTVSKSFFLYELSYAEYDFVSNLTYLLTPNNIYSNISGGAGFFAGYTSNKVVISKYRN